MITRLEIDGFKMFHGFTLDFAPFQIIVGLNGVGKSNVFDALRLLSRLADMDLRTAFQGTESEIVSEAMRGEAAELFTTLPDGSTVSKMTLAVELFIDPTIKDSWGAEEKLTSTRLRYEIAIERREDERGLERLYVVHEQLKPIPRSKKDVWLVQHLGDDRKRWLPELKTGRKVDFISTTRQEGGLTIALHQDGHGGRKSSVAERVERTMLSGVTNTEFPHAFAAREEMRQWRFLQLNPRMLRLPSSMIAPQFVSADGNFLPSALARLQAISPYILTDISRDLAAMVPGIVSLDLEEDIARNRYIIWANMQDGRKFSSRVLSDGTLRLLALLTFKNDPEYRGVLCFEEPENGIHPHRLRTMLRVLQDMTTTFDSPPNDEPFAQEPLRQLLLNTHSPVLIKELVDQTSTQQHTTKYHAVPGLYFAYTALQTAPQRAGMRVTRIVPVTNDPRTRFDFILGSSGEGYPLGEVIRYLETTNTEEAVSYLQQGSRL